MKIKFLFVLMSSAVLLTACGGGGGGGDSNPPPTPDPDASADMPAGAAATVDMFNSTLAAMAADDRANPLGLDPVTPPSSDTTEPQALD